MVAWPKLRLTRPKEMTDIGGKAKEKWARPNDEEDLGPVYIHQSIHVMYCASCGHLNSGGVPSTTEHNNARKSTTSNKSSATLCCAFAAGSSLLYMPFIFVPSASGACNNTVVLLQRESSSYRQASVHASR